MITEKMRKQIVDQFTDDWGSVIPNTPIDVIVDYINKLFSDNIAFQSKLTIKKKEDESVL